MHHSAVCNGKEKKDINKTVVQEIQKISEEHVKQFIVVRVKKHVALKPLSVFL